MSVTAVLHSLRSQRGWTQEELAEKSGVSVRTIRNMESGRVSNPRPASVNLLLSALGGNGSRLATMEIPHFANVLRPLPVLPAPVPGRTGAADWDGPRPPMNSFFGRAGEIARIMRSLAECRIAMLTGPGGVGKTRLSLEVAELVQERVAADVSVVELGRVPAEGANAFSGSHQVLDFVDQVTKGRLLSRLHGHAVGPKESSGQVLVVLDNAEHVPRTAAMLAEHLVQAYSGVRVIVTTRRAVPAPSAQVHEVWSLDAADAVDLVVSRSRSNGVALDLSRDLDAVRALCRELEGMPRAIEFAAERLRSVSIGRLRANVFGPHVPNPSPFDLPHQRSLLSSFNWSLRLLDDRSRDALKSLVLLPPIFTIEDAERSLSESGFTPGEISERLTDLIDNSLVHVHHGQQYSYQVMSQVRTFV